MGKKKNLLNKIFSVITVGSLILTSVPLAYANDGDNEIIINTRSINFGDYIDHFGPTGDEADGSPFRVRNFINPLGEGGNSAPPNWRGSLFSESHLLFNDKSSNKDAVSVENCIGCGNKFGGQGLPTYCAQPSFFLPYFSLSTLLGIETEGGYRTETAEDFCNCVSVLANRGGSEYSDTQAYDTRRLCQQAGNSEIKLKAENNFRKIRESGSLRSLVAAALGVPQDSENCSRDISKNLFKDLLGADLSGDGKRFCSIQSTAYLANLVAPDQDADPNFMQSLLMRSKNLKSTMNESNAALEVAALNGKFQEVIDAAAESNHFQLEYDKILQSKISEIFSNGQTGNPDDVYKVYTPEELRAEVISKPEFKQKIAKYILLSLEDNKDIYGAEPLENTSFDVEKVRSGEVKLTEEDANSILGSFMGRSDSACVEATNDLGAQCKMVSSGLQFRPNDLMAARCKIAESNIQTDLIGDPLERIKAQLESSSTSGPSGDYHVASQMLCYGFAKYGNAIEGMISDDFETQICRATQNGEPQNAHHSGVRAELINSASKDAIAEKVFATTPANAENIIESYTDCTPFDPEVFNDESMRCSGDDVVNCLETISVVKESKAVSIGATESQRGTTEDGKTWQERVAQNAGGGTLFRRSGSNSSAREELGSVSSRGRSARSSISDGAASRARQSLAGSTASSNIDVSRNMGARWDEYSAIEAASSAMKASIESSQGSDLSASAEVSSSSSDIKKMDEFLAEIERLRNENRSLIEQMNKSGKDEIEASDGSKISRRSLEDYDERLEKKQKELLAEKDASEKRLEEAERRLAESKRLQDSGNRVAPVSSTPASISTSAPAGNASRSIASVGSTGDAGQVSGSTGGQSSSGSAQNSGAFYGPFPSQGIVLTSEELSIAKPSLDLGGRSLNDSADIVRAAIEAVKGEVRLPVQYINGKPVKDYILQEQDGKMVIVYLDGETVVVADVDLDVDSAQDEVVVEVTPEAVEEAPVRAPAAQSGRKAWADVEAILDGAQ